jgi:hypothetical protein
MTDNTFHFGKHKGKPLCDVPVSYLEWVVLDHGDDNAVRAAQTELDQRGRNIAAGGIKAESKPAPGQLFKPGQAERAIPKGKHKGKLLSEITDAAVQGMWSSWNGIDKLKSSAFFAEIVAEKERRNIKPGKQTQSAKSTRVKSTAKAEDQHYSWKDPRGVTHLIPNDVDMEGRENEEAPF